MFSTKTPLKAKFGYCAVTADFLHIGHIAFIKACKDRVERLTVGVMSDTIVEQYKNKTPIMNTKARYDLVSAIRYVDRVYVQITYEFPHSVLRLKEFYKDDYLIFDSEEHAREGADILFPRYLDISSTQYKNENIDN